MGKKKKLVFVPKTVCEQLEELRSEHIWRLSLDVIIATFGDGHYLPCPQLWIYEDKCRADIIFYDDYGAVIPENNTEKYWGIRHNANRRWLTISYHYDFEFITVKTGIPPHRNPYHGFNEKKGLLIFHKLMQYKDIILYSQNNYNCFGRMRVSHKV